ncbi:MAG TPA: SGNH hydrolase domain-containing protein [Coriobacteriia bacterium]|nr:SGNH hydrolase domain-containing protein [Coriobacteriia bacterium]
MADPDVHLINLIPQFCDDETCYPVVGDVIVFRDYSHLSADYVAALVPYLRDRIAQVAGS